MKIKCGTYRDGVQARYAHAKIDGHFVRVRHGRVWSSHPTDLTDDIDHLVPVVPWRSTLLGELHVPGMPASYVKTAIKNRDERLTITYFAIEELDEPTMAVPLAEWDLETVHHWMIDHRLPFADYLPITPDFDVQSSFRDITGLGYEGVVLKSSNLPSALGGWYKLKAVQTIDLVVTGARDGNGKYLGLLGALQCSVFTPDGFVEVASVSGMTDDQRVDMSLESPVGKVVEVAYQLVGSQGRLRHPRFVQFRDDKAPRDCTPDQDPNLEEHLTCPR